MSKKMSVLMLFPMTEVSSTINYLRARERLGFCLSSGAKGAHLIWVKTYALFLYVCLCFMFVLYALYVCLLENLVNSIYLRIIIKPEAN